jgi:UDP-N-acetylmuramate dehydrogenase
MNTDSPYTKEIDVLTKELGSTVRAQVLLAPYTTFKIGGPADIFFEAKTTEELIRAIGLARTLSIPFCVLGGGTNILIGDKGIRGLVIKNSTRQIAIRGVVGAAKSGVSSKTAFVEADAGVLLNSLVRFTVEEGLAGLEMHLGLPGTVGGALYMNSKWTKPVGYVGDAVYSAKVLMNDMTVKEVKKSYFNFAYDYSILHKTHEIVLSVVFELPVDDKKRLWEIANNSIAHRRATQPQGVKSAGCIFKNITKEQAISHNTPEHTTSAGYLVDSVGLKGASVGGEKISDQHANFTINTGQATASDVLQLIDSAKEQVKRRYGIELEEEVIRMGEF